jgi:hypothetical protein
VPETDVEVRFRANVEGLRSAISGLNGQLAAAGSQKISAPGLDKMEEGAHKASRAVREAHESLTAFGRVAETTKEKLGEFGREATHFALGFIGLTAAFEAVKHAFEAGAAVETARTRMQALAGSVQAGNEAFEGLERISDDTSTGIERIADAAQSLVSAGTGLEELPAKLDAIARAAQVTGQPVEAIADIFARIQLRGDVSARELFRLTEATGGATRKLAEQYRDLENQQKNYLETQQRAGVASLGEHTGLTGAVFQAFSQEPLRQGFAVIEGFAGTQINRLSTLLIQRFRQGIREIAHESGISEAAVFQLARQGTYTPQELISASDQGRERERNEERIQILDKISTSLSDLNEKGGALSENFIRFTHTALGEWQKATHQIDKDFESVGGQLISHLKGVEIAVGSVTAALIVWNGLKFFGLIGQLKAVAAATEEVATAAKAATVAEGAETAATGGLISGLLRLVPAAAVAFAAVSLANLLPKQKQDQGQTPEDIARGPKPGTTWDLEDRRRRAGLTGANVPNPSEVARSRLPIVSGTPERPTVETPEPERNLFAPVRPGYSGGIPAPGTHLGRWGQVIPELPRERSEPTEFRRTPSPQEIANRPGGQERERESIETKAFQALWTSDAQLKPGQSRLPLVNEPGTQGRNPYAPTTDFRTKPPEIGSLYGREPTESGQLTLEDTRSPIAGRLADARLAPRLPVSPAQASFLQNEQPPADVGARGEWELAHGIGTGKAVSAFNEAHKYDFQPKQADQADHGSEFLKNIQANTKATADGIKDLGKGGGGES